MPYTVSPWSSIGNSPLSPRASAISRALSGGIAFTAPIPNRRTALAARPGMPNSRVSVSVATATASVSSPRQRW